MVCIRPRRCAWMLVHAIALLAGDASAQPARSRAQDTAPRPWAAGVPARDQTTAFELYRAGNVDFTESRYAAALAKYREAIQHWDHPQIRFNIAVSLIHLDQPVEASESLERSLRFGAVALGDDLYAQGLTYQKLLDAQLVRLTVASDEPGARVTLDGKFLFVAPGRMVQVVLPGEHQLVATKDGQSTNAETFVLGAGKPRLYAIRPLAEARVEPKYVAQDPCSVPRATPPTTTTASNTASNAAKAPAVSQPPPAPISNQTQASTVPISLQSNGAIWRVADPSPQASAAQSSTASPFSWAALVKKALEPTPAPSAAASSRSSASPSTPASTASSAPQTTATPLSTAAPLTFASPPIPVYPVPPPPPAYPTTPSYQPPFAPPYPPGYQPPPGVPPTPTYPTPAYPTPASSYSPPTPGYQPPAPTPGYSPPTPAYQPPSYSPPRPPSYPPPLPPGARPNGSPACTSASPQACAPQPGPPFPPPLPPGYSPPPLPGAPPIPTGRRATPPSTTRAPASLPQTTAPQSPRPGRSAVVRPPAATPHTPAVRPTTQTRSTSAPSSSSPSRSSSSSSHSSGTFRR